MGNTTGAASSTFSRAIDAPPIELHFSGCYQYCGARTTREAGKRRQAFLVGTRRAGFATLRIESTRTTTEEVKPIIF